MIFKNFYNMIKANPKMDNVDLYLSYRYNIEKNRRNEEQIHYMQLAYALLIDKQFKYVYDLLGRAGYLQVILKNRLKYAYHMCHRKRLITFATLAILFLVSTFAFPLAYAENLEIVNDIVFILSPILMIVLPAMCLGLVYVIHDYKKFHLQPHDELFIDKGLSLTAYRMMYFVFIQLNLALDVHIILNILLVAYVIFVEVKKEYSKLLENKEDLMPNSISNIARDGLFIVARIVAISTLCFSSDILALKYKMLIMIMMVALNVAVSKKRNKYFAVICLFVLNLTFLSILPNILLSKTFNIFDLIIFILNFASMCFIITKVVQKIGKNRIKAAYSDFHCLTLWDDDNTYYEI